MIQKSIIFGKENGLHMDFALFFVKESSIFESDIKLIVDDREYEGKSLLGVMSVIAVKGEKILVQADGRDEKIAISKLSKLLESK